MNARRSRPHGIIARILGALVEQPQPRRKAETVAILDVDWPLPNPADWARVDLAWNEALR